jgi:hypothetical protein
MDPISNAIRSIQSHVARIVERLDETDYYTLLEVSLDATPEQLRQSYRAIVGAYRVVLEHEHCPRSLGDDIWTVCQRLADAVRTLGDNASRDAHVATFKPAPRPADAPPYHPVHLRPDQPSGVLVTAEPNSDVTIEMIAPEPTRPYGAADEEWQADTEVGADGLPSFALEEVPTTADPRPSSVVLNSLAADALETADTALAPFSDEEPTAVDRVARDPVGDEGDALEPVTTDVEEPTTLDPEGLFAREKGSRE